MAVDKATPANCGRRLIPQILDDLAAAEPDRIIYSFAKSSGLSQGFRHVSARAFTKAVDKTAWLLQKELGRTSEIRAVGYIGPRKFILESAVSRDHRTLVPIFSAALSLYHQDI